MAKRVIPFKLFGEPEELCFTARGMEELERKLGKTVPQIVHGQYVGYELCLTALPICLKKMPPSECEKKIEEYIFGEEGRSIQDIGIIIGHALMAAGGVGKKASEAILAVYYPDLYPIKEEPEPGKNN